MIILWSLPSWARLVQTIKNINDFIDNIVKISETVDKTLTYVTKVKGVSTYLFRLVGKYLCIDAKRQKRCRGVVNFKC